jgi:hypothetical protein
MICSQKTLQNAAWAATILVGQRHRAHGQIGGIARSTNQKECVMGKQVHRITAHESRKITHPVFKKIDKYWLTVKATDFPAGISSAANAREPVGLNRLVYRDVRESLEGTGAEPGTFDLMNKGITIKSSTSLSMRKRAAS